MGPVADIVRTRQVSSGPEQEHLPQGKVKARLGEELTAELRELKSNEPLELPKNTEATNLRARVNLKVAADPLSGAAMALSALLQHAGREAQANLKGMKGVQDTPQPSVASDLILPPLTGPNFA